MDKLISDIEAYAVATGRKPQAILRAAYGAGWGVWQKWVERRSSPTVELSDRIYAYMAANPPKADPEQGEAA